MTNCRFCHLSLNKFSLLKLQNDIFYNKIIQRILFYYVLNSLHDKLVIGTLKKISIFNKTKRIMGNYNGVVSIIKDRYIKKKLQVRRGDMD